MGEIAFVVVFITTPFLVHAGLLTKIFSNNEIEPLATTPTITQSGIDVPLLTTLQNPNPMAARGGAEIIVDDNVLVSTGPVGADEIAAEKNGLGEIRVHVVRENETLSEIAAMFDVTTNTIMWANDITKASQIRPGDTLVILPIAGVRHVVKSGDTVASIAKKYSGNVDEILSYNQLASASDISAGDTIIVPGGAIQAAPTKASSKAKSSGKTNSASGFVHPAPGAVRSQGIHGYNGVDLAGGHGSAIRAAAAGEVIISKSSGWNGGYGQYIVVRHANGTQTLYAHLSANHVAPGANVAAGEVIGGMGSSGRSTGTHLHFEVRGARNPF